MSKKDSTINKNIINESGIWIEPRRFYIRFVAKKEISTHLVNTDNKKFTKSGKEQQQRSLSFRKNIPSKVKLCTCYIFIKVFNSIYSKASNSLNFAFS